MSLKCVLEPSSVGALIILPTTLSPGQEASFSLEITGDMPFSLKEMQPQESGIPDKEMEDIISGFLTTGMSETAPTPGGGNIDSPMTSPMKHVLAAFGGTSASA